MKLQTHILFVLLANLASGPVAFATPTVSNGSTDQLVGDWRGRSLCVTTTRPACTDETVMYHVSKDTPKGDGFHIRMDKLVNGKFETMADPIACSFETTRQQLICPAGTSRWQFRWDGSKLFGALIVADGAFRFIQVDRVKP